VDFPEGPRVSFRGKEVSMNAKEFFAALLTWPLSGS